MKTKKQPSKKQPSKQSLAQKQRWALRKKQEASQRQTHAEATRAKQLLNTLLHKVSESEVTPLPATEHNVALDFLGLRFLQCVIESDTFRAKVQQALRQFDAQMVPQVVNDDRQEVAASPCP